MSERNGKLKAKPTEYNGYWFRSRTEARWAYFFDLIGADYRYELQGYELPHANYLPDFWLPTHELYVEIKGYTPNKRELEKAALLTAASGNFVQMFIGDPYGAMELYDFHFTPWEERSESPIDLIDKTYKQEYIFDIEEEGYITCIRDTEVEWRLIRGQWFASGSFIRSLCDSPKYQGNQTLILRAQLKARQARFEYGETPRKPQSDWYLQ